MSANILIKIKTKIKQNMVPLIIVMSYISIGIIYFTMTEPANSMGDNLLLALASGTPTEETSFYKFYIVIWTVVVSQAVLGFLMTSINEKYNPVATSKMLARQQKDHVVIIGYNNLAERIVSHLDKVRIPYVVIEIDRGKVEELLDKVKPVILNDAIDDVVFEDANVKYCSEVFILSENSREVMVASAKIHELNPKAKIHCRVFDERMADFLKKQYRGINPFSSTKLAMRKIEKLSSNDGRSALILGDNHLSERLVTFLARKKAMVYNINDSFDKEHKEIKNVKRITGHVYDLSWLEEQVNFTNIKEIFICWEGKESFTRSTLLTADIKGKWVKMNVCVRIFDEEMRKMIEGLKAVAISTSMLAFKRLQEITPSDSSIHSNYWGNTY